MGQRALKLYGHIEWMQIFTLEYIQGARATVRMTTATIVAMYGAQSNQSFYMNLQLALIVRNAFLLKLILYYI